MIRILLLTGLVGMVISSPKIASHGGHGYDHDHGSNKYHKPIKYSFSYGIHDSHYGPNFGHSESRDGYSTKGEYYVHLPDGRVQNVKYTVDKYGYHPIVSYKGKAQFPSYGKGVKPQKGYGHR